MGSSPHITPSSQCDLSYTILDGEAARVQLKEMDRVKNKKLLTYIIDGQEDFIKQSLYGSIVSEGNKYPVLLSLDDITGYQGSANTIFATALKALGCMELQYHCCHNGQPNCHAGISVQNEWKVSQGVGK